MMKKANNKIGIPWYRRNVRFNGGDDMGENSISFNLPNSRPKSTPPRQPIKEPVRVPVTDPVTSPILEPELKPFPVPFPTPVPLPLPERNPDKNPYREPTGQPLLPQLPVFPTWATDPNYDWSKHTVPEPEKKNPFEKTIESILTPIVTLFALNQIKNEYIKVNVTDPIYNRMLKDPVLGAALREAEKANLDMEALGTYFANYDWDNVNIDQMTKDLTILIGAAGAARILVFIIGRKVAFRL